MQFIESTSFGVRSAVWTLKSNDASPTIVLFPMMHIGDEGFFSKVKSHVAKMDFVLTEGVKSKTSKLITYSYRGIVKNHKIGLALQTKLTASEINGEIIHADVTAEEFENRWKTIPFFSRLKLSILFPLYGFYLRYFGSRELIAKNALNTESAWSRADLLNDDDDWENAKDVLVDWRDENLLRILDDTLSKHNAENVNIGIVYGAGHMRAVMRYLMDHYNYRVIDSEWLEVIAL